MGRFVTPAVVRLPISGGDWIDIKRQLTHGEQDAMLGRFAPVMRHGEKLEMQSEHVRTTTVLAFLVGWSLTDEGVPVAMNPMVPEADRVAAINALDPDTFDEIEGAINTYVEAWDREKKVTARTNASSNGDGTSGSPSAPAGVSTGSATSPSMTTRPS